MTRFLLTAVFNYGEQLECYQKLTVEQISCDSKNTVSYLTHNTIY